MYICVKLKRRRKMKNLPLTFCVRLQWTYTNSKPFKYINLKKRTKCETLKVNHKAQQSITLENENLKNLFLLTC